MNDKEIKYSKHAEEQIKERNIKKTMVKRTLLQPHQIIQVQKGRKIAKKIYIIEGQKFLHRVVFVEHKNFMEIITTYLTTKIIKYRRDE